MKQFTKTVVSDIWVTICKRIHEQYTQFQTTIVPIEVCVVSPKAAVETIYEYLTVLSIDLSPTVCI